MLTEYVHLCWDEETSQAFRQRLSALDAAFAVVAGRKQRLCAYALRIFSTGGGVHP